MLYVIHAIDKPNQRELRRAHTQAHIAYLKSQPLKICLAGPLLADDEQGVIGSLLVVEAAERSAVQRLADADPYTRAKLFAQVAIAPLRKTVGWTD
jgi:uncharacterized protein YciI